MFFLSRISLARRGQTGDLSAMTLSKQALIEVVEELQPLCGSIIQRVDLVAEQELVLELRRPGRSLYLLLSGRPLAGRVALCPGRPPREIEGGQLQSMLRRRLRGPLCALSTNGRTLCLLTTRASLRLNIHGGRGALLVGDEGTLPPELVPPLPERFPLAEGVYARYAPQLAQLSQEGLRRRLLDELKKRRKKIARLFKKLKGDRARMEQLAATEAAGELLKANLHKVSRGQRSVELQDWVSGAPLTVALDPRLSPRGNLEKIFKQSKRGKRGLPLAEARLAEVEGQLAGLDAEAARLRAAPPGELAELAAPRQEAPAPRGKAARRDPLAGIGRRFFSADGSEIWVGKGAKENDQLSFHLARSFDLWLHARGRTGSHVILRLQKGRGPGWEALLDAAHLAVHYSSAAKEAKAEVMYAEVKRLRKVKGAAPGQVSLSKSKTLMLTMESGRLSRILNSGR